MNQNDLEPAGMFHCIGCGVTWTPERSKDFLDRMEANKDNLLMTMATYDYHCEGCTRAEKVRREVMPGDAADGYILTGFDVDMLAKAAFELGMAGVGNARAVKNFKMVLGACLLRKFDWKQLKTEAPKETT